MILSVLRLEVLPGRADRLVQIFRDQQILETALAQPGCRTSFIAVSEDGREAIVIATWESLQDYKRWTSRPDRGRLSEEISACLASPLTAATIGAVYRVADDPTR